MTSTATVTTPMVASIDQATEAAAGLVARTVALPDDVAIDLLDVGGAIDAVLWQREAFTLAGRGVALRLVLPSGLDDATGVPAVHEALQAIATTDEVDRPGCGPVVLAALPFDRGAPASLVIPAVTVGCDVTGVRWLTTVGPRGTAFPSLPDLARLPAYHPPDSFS